jgi:hypothetical protein
MKSRLRGICYFIFLFFCPVKLLAANVSSYEALKKLIENRGIHSVEDLLPRLDRSMRSNFMLVYSSRSSMQATAKVPRIVLSSSSADFILAITGNSEMAGGQKVEVIEYDREKNRFQSGAIDFNHQGESRFEKNPTSCLKCHSSSRVANLYDESFHPIWDSYPDWPGVYGTSSRGLVLGSSSLKPQKSILEQFERFKSDSAKLPRMRNLVGLRHAAEQDLAKINSRFGNRIARLNFKKLADTALHRKNYPEYKDALLSTHLSNEQFVKALPEKDREEFLKNFDERIDAISDSTRNYTLNKTKRYQNLLPVGSDEVYAAKYGAEAAGAYQFPNIALRKLTGDKHLPDVMVNFDQDKEFFYSRLDFVLEKLGIDPGAYNLTLEKSSHATTQSIDQFDVFKETLNGTDLSTCFSEKFLKAIINVSGY